MNDEKLEKLFAEAEATFANRNKIGNKSYYDLQIIQEAVESNNESISTCFDELLKRAMELKNEEMKEQNKIYFKLGYNAGVKAEADERALKLKNWG